MLEELFRNAKQLNCHNVLSYVASLTLDLVASRNLTYEHSFIVAFAICKFSYHLIKLLTNDNSINIL